jgi:hypothetical protein
MNLHQTRPGAAPLRRRRAEAKPSPTSPAPRVIWAEGAEPDCEESALILEALTQKGLTTVEDVARYVGDMLYWRDLLRGGWAIDIVLLRPLYRREAREALERLDGRLIRIV